ncbi:MAG TPA: twin-arginine translocase subunit TatC [Candidatus Bathyarchaeia archaeon]|nr:twin-arginine translocase subunit TatC [Candidatus Bathyarchaeia archaeon]
MSDRVDSDKPIPLWDHITELSARIKIWIYSFLISTLVFLVAPTDLSFIQNPFQIYPPLITKILLTIRNRLLPPQYILIGGTVTTPLELLVVGAAVFGFAVSIPVLAYEIYKFIDPALKPEERQPIYGFVTAFSLLFLTGALFAFFVLLPFIFLFSIPFFQAVGVSTLIYADEFYNLVFFVILVSGLAFTIPVFFVLLVKLHVIGTQNLRKNRKYVWAFTLILTAVASPDGGPLADIALFIPMIILIEGAIWYAKRYEKGISTTSRFQITSARCEYCGAMMDPETVFCDQCGKSRI